MKLQAQNVDLRKIPYELDDEAIAWVESTIEGMTDEEKIGQLFVNMGASRDRAYLKGVLDHYHIGAVRYNPGPASDIYDQNQILLEESKIPLLIAANTEAGGNGACTDGTEVGVEVKIGATNDPKYAYEMGRIAGIEASAIGCNWSFAPIVDIMYNWRNPIIAMRSFASDADVVLEHSLAYMKGIQESGILPAAKHFPGDGVDERDQHLSFSVNQLTADEWEATYGKVYRGLIEAGLPSIMAGHIHQPAWSRKINPDLEGKETLPATLSPELITGLLRGELGFNGLVVTDASHMVGLTSAMRRSDLVPQAIMAGCDLFLFFNDPDEDFAYMMNAYKDGRLTETRLMDALRRILGLKAKAGLHLKKKGEFLLPKDEAMDLIGKPEHKAMFREVADQAITLVREEEGVFPITPDRYKRILVVNVKGEEGGFGALLGGGSNAGQVFVDLLKAQGYHAELFVSVADKLKGMSPEEVRKQVANIYSAKVPIASLKDHYDLIINICDVNPGTVMRPVWPLSKGTPDIPFYVHEVPTLVISVQCPYMLADIPQAKTYINCYDSRPVTFEVLLEKLRGESDFKGVSNIDVACRNLTSY